MRKGNSLGGDYSHIIKGAFAGHTHDAFSTTESRFTQVTHQKGTCEFCQPWKACVFACDSDCRVSSHWARSLRPPMVHYKSS